MGRLCRRVPKALEDIGQGKDINGPSDLGGRGHGAMRKAFAIPPNREVGLPDDSYFPVGDVAGLAAKLTERSTVIPTSAHREALRRSLQSRFDWRNKAEQTATVLRAAMRVE